MGDGRNWNIRTSTDFNRTAKELSNANRYHGKRRTKRRLVLQKATLTKSNGRGALAARLCAYDAGIAGHCDLIDVSEPSLCDGYSSELGYQKMVVERKSSSSRGGMLSNSASISDAQEHYGMS